jgi:precorrin-3B synthase
MACDTALTLLSRIAEMGGQARGRDLSDKTLSGAVNGLVAGASERGFSRSLIGNASLRNGHIALGVALPFGQATAARLKAFAEKALTLDIEDIRPAPKRTLVAICGSETAARELGGTALALGFITSPNDPTQAISACPGAPDCASGHMPARALAAEIAKHHADLFDGSVSLHVSGCAKGCAHPAVSDLTLVGTAAGIGLVANGTARDEAAAFADRDAAGRAFATVARIVSAERLPGETTAHAIHRIGLPGLAEAFGKRGT